MNLKFKLENGNIITRLNELKFLNEFICFTINVIHYSVSKSEYLLDN